MRTIYKYRFGWIGFIISRIRWNLAVLICPVILERALMFKERSEELEAEVKKMRKLLKVKGKLITLCDHPHKLREDSPI